MEDGPTWAAAVPAVEEDPEELVPGGGPAAPAVDEDPDELVPGPGRGPAAPVLDGVATGPVQASVLQGLLASPTHVAPPPDGEGLVQVRVCIPPPHPTEQAPKTDQPPLMTGIVGEQ